MAKRIFIDCETLPPDRSDPLIRDKTEAFSEDEYRKLALVPEYGRLLCVGLIIEQDGQIINRGTLGRDRRSMLFHLDKARTLQAFWKLLQGFDPYKDLLIGWNILDFDLHFLCMRSVIKKVKPSIEVCFARFRNRPVYDLMWEFQHWRKKISLDEVAKILGFESSKKEEVNGSKVYDLFLEGRHQEICDYCLADCELTRLLYYRINFLKD
jgi:hypothetical protein